jgi:spermidine/putrescine transport system ATP-binding protein
VLILGEEMGDRPPYRRPVNTVFQHYALFPHLTVGQNIGYGLAMTRTPKAERDLWVREALDLVRLPGAEQRRPAELSGGQQQRVALARALVNRPAVLLLDEPLGALDLKLRKAMQAELKRLNREVGVTFIYVTHDQDEALTMSDRIAVMCEGRIEQLGAPEEIYERPQSRFVADFIGLANFLVGRTAGIEGDVALVEVEGAGILRGRLSRNARGSERVALAVRPERIIVVAEATEPPAGWNVVDGVAMERIYRGTHVELTVRLPSGASVAVLASHVPDAAGSATSGRKVTLAFDPEHATVVAG